MSNNKDKPTLVELEQPPSEMQKVLAELERTIPEMLASQRAMAKLVRAKYLALVESGFTKDEALALCEKLEW